MDRSDTWDGGFKRRNSKGKKVYIIRQRIAGKLYEVSTRCTSSAAADAQHRRFQADPDGYKPGGDAQRTALTLDVDLAEAFLKYSRDVKKNCLSWVYDQQNSLAWWQEQLDGCDLRRLTADRIVAALETLPKRRGWKQNITVLKTLYSWLRNERRTLTTAEDPTYGTIKVPQSKPEQIDTVKAITLAQYKAAMRKLEDWPRDALHVLAGTGWHVSELQRFASGGKIEKHPRNDQWVLMCPLTKGGVPLRTEVTAKVAAAAKRIRKKGAVDYFELQAAIKATGAKFNPGYLRHSVATWAINSGDDPAKVAAFLGHKSPATTRKFYATHAVPFKIATLGD